MAARQEIPIQRMGKERAYRSLVAFGLAAVALTVLLIGGPLHNTSAQVSGAHSTKIEHPESDVRFPSDRSINTQADAALSSAVKTSEFMAGTTAVQLFFVQCVNSPECTELWTDEERAMAVEEVRSAMDWWVQRATEHNVFFQPIIVNSEALTVPVSVEPISREAWSDNVWVTEVMTTLGYPGYTSVEPVRAFNDDLRHTMGTDWAVTFFFVDASNDPDHLFSDGRAAYAWLGGPSSTIPFPANGYRREKTGAVIAHEKGHLWYGLDQYWSAHMTCDEVSGVLEGPNGNSQWQGVPEACVTDVPSIMRGWVHPFTIGALDDFAAWQIGWHDANGDGIVDVGGTFTGTTTATIQGGVIHVEGTMVNVKWETLDPDIDINKITNVTIVNPFTNQTWNTTPTDGAFDGKVEGFSADIPAEGNTVLVACAKSYVGGETCPITVWGKVHTIQLPIIMKE